MMFGEGCWYLHVNGKLIYKRIRDERDYQEMRESTMVVRLWTSGTNIMRFLLDAHENGAPLEEVRRVAAIYQLDWLPSC